MITICDHSGAQICAHRAETSLEISFFDGSGQWRAKCSRTRNGDSPPSSYKNGVSKRLTGYFLRQLTLANDCLQALALDDCHLGGPVAAPAPAIKANAFGVDLGPTLEVIEHAGEHALSRRIC